MLPSWLRLQKTVAEMVMKEMRGLGAKEWRAVGFSCLPLGTFVVDGVAVEPSIRPLE